MSAGVVLPKVILQVTVFFISFRIAIQFGSSLTVLCLVPKVCSVFNNRVLSHNHMGHTRAMVMACIIGAV